MTSEQFEAFLAQAGVDAAAVGAPERLLLPEPQVDEARTARAGAAFVPPALLHVRSDALSAAGIEAAFDEDARRLVLSARQDLAFGLAESGTPFTSGEAGGTRFHVATDRPSAFGLWSVAGPLAIGAIDARAIELRVVHAWPSPTGLDDSGVQGDSGVARHPNDSGVEAPGVARRPNDSGVDLHSGVVRPRSRWDETLAAGRIARAMEPGASQAATIAARRWTRGLTGDQRALIERFAIVRARDVARQLARIQEGQGVDQQLDFAWQGICWDRDDVEGLRVLLREAHAGETLTSALRAADEIGRAVRFSWPSDVDVHDERLQRISEADPGAWWGSTRRQVVWL
jgi:hypothetical protein